VPVQRRPITPEQFRQLTRIGVLGEEPVTLQDGWIVYRQFPFAFSDEAAALARAAGIVLDEPEALSEESRAGTGQAPDGERTRRLAARRLWRELEPIMLILVEQGGAHFATALSWLAEPDVALGGQSPASWLAAGRDAETVALIARRDAARWSD
jgi:hypothetical protein